MILFQLRFSCHFFTLLLIIYLGGFFCTWMAVIYLWAKWLITIMLITHFIFLIKKYFLFASSKSISTFYFDGEHWQLKLKSEEICVAELTGETIVTRYFILLNFRGIIGEEHHQLFLFPDSVLPPSFRRLRTLLVLN